MTRKRPTLVLLLGFCFLSTRATALPSSVRVLHPFSKIGTVINPVATDGAGNLFGDTVDGGEFDSGTVFKLSKSDGGTSNLTILHSFNPALDGWSPVAGMAIDRFGNLYGTTEAGVPNPDGPSGPGTVFELSPQANGSYAFKTLHGFSALVDNQNSDGAVSMGNLAVAADGTVYGATTRGGPKGEGTIFSVSPTGAFATLYSFEQYDGNSILSLSIDASGNLFGARYYGDGFAGDIFELQKLSTSWVYRVIYTFTNGPDGGYPFDDLSVDSKGNVFGASRAYPAGGVVFQLSPDGSGGYGFHVLHTFSGGDDGMTARSGVSIDANGAIYGFAVDPSASTSSSFFRITGTGGSAWTFFTLLHFDQNSFVPAGWSAAVGAGSVLALGKPPYLKNTLFELAPGNGGYVLNALLSGGEGLEGGHPLDLLTTLPDGTIVTTLSAGGAWGNGTVLAIHPAGSSPPQLEILHTFAGVAMNDGANPSGGLSADSSGNLYGTTLIGGDPRWNAGTIFELSKGSSGFTYSVLYRFSGGADGFGPVGVVSDSAGHLYGMTRTGTIYELTIGSSELKVLKSLPGADSAAPLVRDSSGNLFGTYLATVFKVTSSGSFSTIRVFNHAGDAPPLGPLILDESGALYGCTASAVFRMSRSGDSYTALHTFASLDLKDGNTPTPPLTIDGSGMLVGATSQGGDDDAGAGTVFRVSRDGSGFTVLTSFSASLDGAFPNGGLAIDSTGQIIGTAAVTGEWGGGVLFTIASSPPSLAVTPASLPSAKQFETYGPLQLAGAGGTPPYRFGWSAARGQLTRFPTGLGLSLEGLISGIPTGEGQYKFFLVVQDADGFLAVQPFSLDIEAGVTPMPPFANDVAAATRPGLGDFIYLSATDPTGAAQDLVFEIVGQPQSGILSNFDSIHGTVVYTPNPGFSGVDYFQFDVKDEFGTSFLAEVTVDVLAPNIDTLHPPTPAPISKRPSGKLSPRGAAATGSGGKQA